MNGFRDCTYTMGPGVYLLYLGETLQYVGQTNCLARRIGDHYDGRSTMDGKTDGFVSIEFDRVLVLPCEPEGLAIIERRLIQQLRPELNKMHTTGVGENYTFTDGPLKGMTIKAKKPKVYDYKSGGTDLDEYLEELEGKLQR